MSGIVTHLLLDNTCNSKSLIGIALSLPESNGSWLILDLMLIIRGKVQAALGQAQYS
jgi:hypothetical protein